MTRDPKIGRGGLVISLPTGKQISLQICSLAFQHNLLNTQFQGMSLPTNLSRHVNDGNCDTRGSWESRRTSAYSIRASCSLYYHMNAVHQVSYRHIQSARTLVTCTSGEGARETELAPLFKPTVCLSLSSTNVPAQF